MTKEVVNLDARRMVEEVRECDRKIIEWLKNNGKLSEEDYHHIGRPSLVAKRIDVMKRLGFVEEDEDGNFMLVKDPIIDLLPVNSDVIDAKFYFRPYIYYLIYNIARECRPKYVKELYEIFCRVVGKRHDWRSFAEMTKKLIDTGILKRDEVTNHIVPAVELLTENNDYYVKLYWEDEESGRFMGRGRKRNK